MGSIIATVGYEGRTLDTYLAVLKAAAVTVLCDVRKNPLSRKKGFSKKALAAACATEGIRYEHLPELGIASERRKAIETEADRQRLFAEYARELPAHAAALATIASWARSGKVALTCFEHDPSHCHRHCVAIALEREHHTATEHL
jgi:uncharacterized protein (DUF488 family)